MEKSKQKLNFGLIMAVYLLGIFMGAIDTGIVTPARTVIQNALQVSERSGIWMITVYTLAYAASIPVMGKLADKYGRKYIYLISISLFGTGSLLCGLSSNFGSFEMLLVARAIQAIGGGGILPVATAEFGTTFPKEKRGMALGLVGGVYGVANIFGASAGSAIIDIFGKNNWQFIFYINIPITLFIIIAGLIALPNSKEENVKKIDFAGIFTVVIMVVSILYGLKNIDYFNFAETITSIKVYPFIIIFALLLPLFIFIENRAEDPVINITYFKNKKILITLVISFITGIVMMGMIFVPQFAENSLYVASGSGGYFVIILGVFAGVGAPLSGTLIDKFGAKFVLFIGFSASVTGALFIMFVAAPHPSMITILICLMLLGIGIGFTMGTPINYMMLDNIKEEESNSGLATVSLIRSIGTAIAPAIMIGFISHAGMAVQGNVMTVLPDTVSIPALPYAAELNETFTQLKANPSMASKLEGVNIPDLSAMSTIKIDMSATSGEFKLPEDIMELLKSSDVTTITDNSKKMADYMFTQMTPGIISKISGGLNSGIGAMQTSQTEIDQSISGMEATLQKMGINPATATAAEYPQAAQMISAVSQMKTAKNSITGTISKMQTLENAVPGAFETAKTDYISEIDSRRDAIEDTFQTTLNKGFMQVYSTVAIASAFAMLILLLYSEKARSKNKEQN